MTQRKQKKNIRNNKML